jgi:putative DNA primase/helicase
VIGYALTGIATEQVFWILWGLGANGKSTLLEIIMRAVLGEAYSWTMPFPTMGWTNAMSEYQKASLVGQRLIQASEVTRRASLNEEMIKALTGGDTINARHPYGRPFQYEPVAKIFLRVNDKPIIRDQSHGMWRRVKLVPFTQTFLVNTTLADELRAEAAGILAWAVRGCLDWKRDGLQHPDAVNVATKEYQDESDLVAEFISDRCVVAENCTVGATPLFESYRSWCDARQLPDADRFNQKVFGSQIRKRFTPIEGRTVSYRGIGLRAAGM